MADLILGSPKYPVRLSYVHIWEPKEDVYQAMILIDKRDKTTVKLFKEAEAEATQKGIETKWGGKLPKNLPVVLKDGDEYDGDGDGEALVGMWYVNANNRKRRPGIVDNNVKPLSSIVPADKAKIYSGVFAYVNVSLFPYAAEDGKKKGVGVGLENIQTLGYGDNLGGGAKPAESVFGKVSVPDSEDDDDLDDDDDLM